MILLSRRGLLAVAAVVDVALHARPQPVAAKMLASRHDLPPRHLETLLQSLVRAGILKGVRGPRGGYELNRERRRITVADIVRASLSEPSDDDISSPLVEEVVAPAIEAAGRAFLDCLEGLTVEDLCRQAEQRRVMGGEAGGADFTI